MKKSIAILASMLVVVSAIDAAQRESKPNIIFILIDDMGWTDLRCQGSKFYVTPNIDRFAREGMRFTQAYSACTVCSPTRAALMTGKYPARLHITDWIPGTKRPYAKLSVPDWRMYLPLEEGTIASALRSAGYTTASIGKWHLGGREYFPDRQGFDVNLAGTDKGSPPNYFSPYGIPTLPDGPKGEYLPDRLTDEALKFIEANQSKPFFLYLPHYAVHTPLMGKPDVIKKYQQKAKPDSPQHNATFAALVESVDDSVGRILKKLANLKLDKQTIVIFNSDNGGLILNEITSNLPLRAGKGSAYEGGVRVPLIIKWPGVTKAGGVCDTPVITYDFYPTILEMAGVKPQKGRVLDGESIVPLVRRTGSLRRDTLYWHYPHYHPGGATPYSAIRVGDWKLIEFFEDNRIELYNLKDDLSERTDLAGRMPEKARELQAKLTAWRSDVGAQLPAPNPNYDAARDAESRLPRKSASAKQ